MKHPFKKQPADKEILEKIRKGEDNEVLNYLYKQSLPKIKRYILANSGQEDDAYDVFQEALMAFYRYVKQNKFKEQYDVDGFLYSVSRNLWINKAKKEKKMVHPEHPKEENDPADSAEEMMISEERRKTLLQLLEKTGSRCKQLLQLSFFYGMSPSEICEKMGFANENAVKTKKYKCKEKLAEIIRSNASYSQLLKND